MHSLSVGFQNSQLHFDTAALFQIYKKKESIY